MLPLAVLITLSSPLPDPGTTSTIDIEDVERPEDESPEQPGRNPATGSATEDGNVPGSPSGQTVPGQSGNTQGTGGKPLRAR